MMDVADQIGRAGAAAKWVSEHPDECKPVEIALSLWRTSETTWQAKATGPDPDRPGRSIDWHAVGNSQAGALSRLGSALSLFAGWTEASNGDRSHGAALRWLADRCDAGEVESVAVHWVHPENAPRPPWHPQDGTKTAPVQRYAAFGAGVPECWNRRLLYDMAEHAMSANYRRGERAGRANAGQPRKAGWSIDES